MKSFLKPTLAAILAVTFISAVSSTPAAETNAPKKAKPAPAAAPAAPALEPRAKPYGGTVSAVDKSAMTITVKKKRAAKTFSVTSSTRITKVGKPATFDDAVVGEECGVSYTETAEGKTGARSIRLGAKPAKPEAAEKNADKSENKPKKEKSADAARPAEQQ